MMWCVRLSMRSHGVQPVLGVHSKYVCSHATFYHPHPHHPSHLLACSTRSARSLYHIGVIKGLFYAGLLPRVVAGSSAGSIIAAFVGTNTDEEVRSG